MIFRDEDITELTTFMDMMDRTVRTRPNGDTERLSLEIAQRLRPKYSTEEWRAGLDEIEALRKYQAQI